MSPFARVEPWDAVAGGYAAEVDWVMGPFSRRAAELAALSPDAEVVDVAAGPGTLALQIAPRVASVHAIDFSERMVDALRSAARARGLTNVHATVGDGQALPYEVARFTAAFSMFGLMFFPDRSRGFAELRRVLRPGGVAVVSSWAPFDRSPLMELMFGALAAADSDWRAPQYDPSSLENYDTFVSELRAAGFADVRVEPHTEVLPPMEADALWARMVRSSAPLVMLRRSLGEEVWAAHEARALAYLRERVPGTTLSTTSYFGLGRAA